MFLSQTYSRSLNNLGSLFFFCFYYFKRTYVGRKRSGRAERSVCSMEAKSVFNLHRALAQPVKMCMFDFPVTILDDLVSSESRA